MICNKVMKIMMMKKKN